jgi:iron complex outermembrane receptor protein
MTIKTSCNRPRAAGLGCAIALLLSNGASLAAESQSALDEVTVIATRATTATKTDTALVETPQAISVVTADQIASRGAIGLQEALRYTAGLRTEPNGADFRFDYVTARGGFEAADYVDGMRQPTSFYTPRVETYNLERVEVLRGPSSVLYGQGAAGGIVNSVTKRPRFDFGAQAGVQGGSFERKQAEVDVTGSVNEAGTVAGRLVGVVRDAGNQVDFGKDNRTLAAPSLRWQPDERTDIVLEGLYQRDRAASIASFLPVNATLLAPAGRRLRFGAYLGEPSHNFYNSKQVTGSLLASHRFSDALIFTSGLRYNRSDTHNGDIEPSVWDGLENPFLDADNRILPRYRYDAQARLDMLTVDNNLRFDFQAGRFSHKLLGGIDYLRSRLQSAFIFVEADPIDIYAPVYGGVPDAALEAYPQEVNAQLGFYVQDQVRYADRVTFVIGARRDRARTAVAGSETQIDQATTFRTGLIVDVGGHLSPYVSYSESFQPTIGLNFYGQPFVPQRGKQYEAGVKWQPDPGTLVTVAAFDIKGTNRLETDPTNGSNQIQQGEVKSRGFEMEASRMVSNDFSVSASFSHIDAEIGRSTDPLQIGLPISSVPKNQVSFWGEKAITLRDEATLHIGLGARYMGNTVEAVVFDDVVERLRTPGFTLADGLVALDWRQWSLAVNATNLLDKRYYASCSVRSACSAGYGRNVIGTLSYRF